MLGLHPKSIEEIMNKAIPFLVALGFLTACGGGNSPASLGSQAGKLTCDMIEEAKKAAGDNPLKALGEMSKLAESDKYKSKADAIKEKSKDFTPEQKKEMEAAAEKACPKLAELKKLGK